MLDRARRITSGGTTTAKMASAKSSFTVVARATITDLKRRWIVGSRAMLNLPLVRSEFCKITYELFFRLCRVYQVTCVN